ncbi:MAG: winged helix-turn-helix domain-containing protein [Candidatus Bathyarchaeota archaeon]|nr:winged helix-turn-helix domain-containing protein [Candidatus Bathyarchaeota archaeon]
MRKRKSGVKNLFVSTSEEILTALLDDELSCGELAERVGITEQHLSRLLPRLENHQLIYSKYPKMRSINQLTGKGRLLALLTLRKKEP